MFVDGSACIEIQGEKRVKQIQTLSEVDILMKKVGFRNVSKVAHIPVWGKYFQ